MKEDVETHEEERLLIITGSDQSVMRSQQVEGPFQELSRQDPVTQIEEPWQIDQALTLTPEQQLDLMQEVLGQRQIFLEIPVLRGIEVVTLD